MFISVLLNILLVVALVFALKELSKRKTRKRKIVRVVPKQKNKSTLVARFAYDGWGVTVGIFTDALPKWEGTVMQCTKSFDDDIAAQDWIAEFFPQATVEWVEFDVFIPEFA